MANPWALPTSGNLADDDYRRSMRAWFRAHPYMGAEIYDSRGVQDLVSGGIDSLANLNPERDAWDLDQRKAWSAQLTPEQRAEYARLMQERNAKLKRNGMLAALAAFGGVAGAGALGAGALGGGGIGTLPALPEFGLSTVPTGGFASIPELAYMPASAGGIGTLPALPELGLSYAAPLTESAISPLVYTPAAAAGGAAGAAAGGGGSGASAAPGLSGYYTGAGGVDGSLVGSGVTNATGGSSSLLNQIQSLLGGSGGGGVNWTNLLGNLAGGAINSYTSGKAANAQLQAGQEANALLREMWQQGRTDQAPWREAGAGAVGQIQALLKDPSSITKQADYQFGLDQGMNALNNSAAARGMTYSGQQGKALQRYGQDYAGTKLNESYNRLASLAGLGQQATAQTNNLGAVYGDRIANNIENQGNVQGSAYIGQGNAWGNALGGALNGWNDQQLINALLKGGN